MIFWVGLLGGERGTSTTHCFYALSSIFSMLFLHLLNIDSQFSGGTYVNAFYNIARDCDETTREFSLGVARCATTTTQKQQHQQQHHSITTTTTPTTTTNNNNNNNN